MMMKATRTKMVPVFMLASGVLQGQIPAPIYTLSVIRKEGGAGGSKAGRVSNRIDNKAKEESFGLISLASTGPILMVLILGLFYKPSTTMTFDNSMYINFEYSNYITQTIISFKEVANFLPIHLPHPSFS